MTGAAWRYDEAMQRILIVLTLVLLVAFSVGVGIAAVRWPHLWH